MSRAPSRRCRLAPWALCLALASPGPGEPAGAGIALDARWLAATQADAPLRQAPAAAAASVEATASFPAPCTFLLLAPTSSWSDFEALEADLYLAADAPTNTEALVHVKDRDGFWYQRLLPGCLAPGETNRLRTSLLPGTPGWEPRGHRGVWHFGALVDPIELGVRLFAKQPYAGPCLLTAARGIPRRPAEAAPIPSHVRPNRDTLPCHEKFELSFRLQDRYVNPFDPEEVAAAAVFVGPDGGTSEVAACFTQDYYRETHATGERYVPCGPPYWQARFTPVSPGRHLYSLRVRDRWGEGVWGPGAFTATPGTRPGFVRVCARDPRYFEFSDGSAFFPLGHNVRSAFDERMDRRFPTRQRWPEGSAAYARYFADMSRHGENMAEVWCAPWSLGLEWRAGWPGYHGVGRFHLRHAWELDRVLELAERHGIYINLVIHNHGKFSTWSDQSWDDNPFNTRNGGFLEKPEAYFSDARAKQAARRLLRYTGARWGYSPNIFAWELFSELDLTGSEKDKSCYRRPEVVEWHREMGEYIRGIDPGGHMVSTHVCGSYKNQNTNIIALSQMDLCPVDAYHNEPDPLRVVGLMRETVAFNAPYDKPVLITEFGGTSQAAGVRHLDLALHAALWASACMPMGGTPLFWWWQLVEEQDFYPKYGALAAFMRGEDRRGPDFAGAECMLLTNGVPLSGAFEAVCLRSSARALGWVYDARRFDAIDPAGPPATTNLVLWLDGLADGPALVEFWDTRAGRVTVAEPVAVSNGVLRTGAPPFARDFAFKVKR